MLYHESRRGQAHLKHANPKSLRATHTGPRADGGAQGVSGQARLQAAKSHTTQKKKDLQRQTGGALKANARSASTIQTYARVASPKPSFRIPGLILLCLAVFFTPAMGMDETTVTFAELEDIRLKIVKQKNTYFRQQTSTDQDKIHKKLEELYGKLANKLKHDVDYTDCTDWTEKKARLAGYKRLFAIARQAADDEYIEEFTDNKNYATELERVDQEEIDRIKKENTLELGKTVWKVGCLATIIGAGATGLSFLAPNHLPWAQQSPWMYIFYAGLGVTFLGVIVFIWGCACAKTGLGHPCAKGIAPIPLPLGLR